MQLQWIIAGSVALLLGIVGIWKTSQLASLFTNFEQRGGTMGLKSNNFTTGTVRFGAIVVILLAVFMLALGVFNIQSFD